MSPEVTIELSQFGFHQLLSHLNAGPIFPRQNQN